ncbi:hypothetical protein ACJJTC_017502 [Scirpophaga incertulas]
MVLLLSRLMCQMFSLQNEAQAAVIKINIVSSECVAEVCSCAHAPRLPAPVVSASTVVLNGEIFANISWSLPQPKYPYRLPKNLLKQSYKVSIGKQMVTDAHPSPWFAHTVSRHVEAGGLVASGDTHHWLVLPITERERPRNDMDSDIKHKFELDVKLLARVHLVDGRGCTGPSGNATAYDPEEAKEIQIGNYILWAVFGGLCVLTMVVVIVLGSRLMKRLLATFRPAAVSTPLTPVCQRPAWLSLSLRS